MCPEELDGTTRSSQKSDLCIDAIEIMGASPDSSRAAQSKSNPLPPENNVKSQSPLPQGSSGIASLSSGIREPCPIEHDWEEIDQPTALPSFHAG